MIGKALIGAGLIGLTAIAGSLPASAQYQAGGKTINTPYGRAPSSFADLVERVKPAVVSIHVTSGGKSLVGRSRGSQGLPNIPKDNPLHDFFKKNFPRGFKGAPRHRHLMRAQGSGFFVSEDGYIVTNNHVIDGASKILVSQNGREKLEAELIGTDPRTDIALLKVKAKRSFPFVKFAHKKVRAGDWVVAVGNPFGLGGTVTAGIVSAMGRDIGSGPYDFIQIDAAVNKGNSGGPAFNLNGEVIGVNTAIYSPSGGNVGIAFAVPARTAESVVQQLKARGSVKRGWLGVKIQNIDADTAAGLGMSKAKGALVSEITPNGPASRTDLHTRDAIIAVDDEAIEDSRDLARKIAAIAPNKRVAVKVVRDGHEKVINVTLGTFPTSSKQLAKIQSGKPATTTVSALGLTLAPAAKSGGVSSRTEGVRISDVDPGSNAAEKGLKEGDYIVGAGTIKVGSPNDVIAAVEKAKKRGLKAVLLAVKPSGRGSTRFVGVRLSASKG